MITVLQFLALTLALAAPGLVLINEFYPSRRQRLARRRARMTITARN